MVLLGEPTHKTSLAVVVVGSSRSQSVYLVPVKVRSWAQQLWGFGGWAEPRRGAEPKWSSVREWTQAQGEPRGGVCVVKQPKPRWMKYQNWVRSGGRSLWKKTGNHKLRDTGGVMILFCLFPFQVIFIFECWLSGLHSKFIRYRFMCGIPLWLSSKRIHLQCRRHGLIPGLGRSPGEGNGNPLQYSCLGKPMDRGACGATVHGAARVRHDWTKPPPPPHRFM